MVPLPVVTSIELLPVVWMPLREPTVVRSIASVSLR